MRLFGGSTGIRLALGVAILLVASAKGEMDQLVMETQLSHGFYPGSLFTTKLYLHPETRWFRINLQRGLGDPNVTGVTVAMAIRVSLDPVEDTGNLIERNWLDASANPQLNPAERHLFGAFPFYTDSVFEISILCNLDKYEVSVNSFDKFSFAHPVTAFALQNFDVMRVMADSGTVDMCWAKYDMDLIGDVAASANQKCSIPIQHSLCDGLVCKLFADPANMYTASPAISLTAGLTTAPPALTGLALASLEEVTEQVCCLEEMLRDVSSRPFEESLQAIVNMTSELLHQNADSTWEVISKVSRNGPLSLLKNLENMAQAIGEASTPPLHLTTKTSTIECKLSTDSLSNFVSDGWSFSPSDMGNDVIKIDGSAFANLELNGTETAVTVFAVSLEGQVELINAHQDKLGEKIGSDIISISVFGPDGLLSVPISYTRTITMFPKVIASEPLYPTCAFWDFNTEIGNWSVKGCRRVGSTDLLAAVSKGTSVECFCNHTTNFAILMRVTPFEESEQNEQALKALTVIGCFISILALLMALGFFIFVKHSSLDTERILIHRHLMGALLVAMILFLIGTFLVDFKIPCQIVAFLQHYFYLAVFGWMLVEGVHLYRLIVTVYGSEKQMAKIYYSVGWAVPLLVVIISAAAKWSDYGIPGKGCWLNQAYGFIWAFVAPACLIMLINLVVLGLVVKTTVLASKLTSQDNLATVKTGLRSSLVLLPMLGITWAIGMVPHTICTFIFVILNSTQGLWLVIVCCLLNGEVRNAFKQTINKKMGLHSASVEASSATATSAVSKSVNDKDLADVD